MPQDPTPRYIITLDFSGVTSTIIHKREWPVTPADLAIAFYVCHHLRYPDLPARIINDWLDTPLGKMARQWLRGPQRRGPLPGPRYIHDAADFVNQVREIVHAIPSYRVVTKQAVLDWLEWDRKTYNKYLLDCQLTHDELVQRARGR